MRTIMNTAIDQLKTNIETNVPHDTRPVTESVSADTLRFASSIQLKLVIAASAVMAAWLSYRTVNEAIALHRELDQAQAAAGKSLSIKLPDSSASNITETKPRIAGL